MQKRILVTGANGFTGKHLCKKLETKDYDVVRLSSRSGIGKYTCDLLQFDDLKTLIQGIRPDQVIHLAAISSVDHQDFEKLYATNVVGTCNLLRAMETVDASKIIVASSANVYGNADQNHPITEDTPPNPVNHYATSKLAMEYMVKTWFDRLPIVLTRPFNYTGPGQSLRFLIPKIVKHFSSRTPYIELGNLNISRDISSVHDVVEAMISILESRIEGEVLNICSGKEVSLRNIVSSLEERCRHSIEIRVNPNFVRKNEVVRLIGSFSKLNRLTGWSPKENLEYVLQEMLEKERS